MLIVVYDVPLVVVYVLGIFLAARRRSAIPFAWRLVVLGCAAELIAIAIGCVINLNIHWFVYFAHRDRMFLMSAVQLFTLGMRVASAVLILAAVFSDRWGGQGFPIEPNRPQGRSPVTDADRFANLQRLLDEGIISQREFQEKRQALLDGL